MKLTSISKGCQQTLYLWWFHETLPRCIVCLWNPTAKVQKDDWNHQNWCDMACEIDAYPAVVWRCITMVEKSWTSYCEGVSEINMKLMTKNAVWSAEINSLWPLQLLTGLGNERKCQHSLALLPSYILTSTSSKFELSI